MAYDEGLAERIRSILEERDDVSEKKMFGGLCFLVGGKMCCGVVKDELMVHVGAAAHTAALQRPHARPMDFTGRPLTGLVYVAAAGFESDGALAWWLEQGVASARGAAKKPRSRRA